MPTCGCDGTVYSSDCDAASAGVDINLLGGCTPPAGMFSCGAGFCQLATQYCEVQVSDVASIPSSFSCKDIPSTCSTIPNCACLANEPCGALCKGDAATGLTATCPGG
jgi:hypothetical protein